MSDRTADDVCRDLIAIAPKCVYVSIEGYERLVMEAPFRKATAEELFGPAELRPTVNGLPIEWRMDYHGAPTLADPYEVNKGPFRRIEHMGDMG